MISLLFLHQSLAVLEYLVAHGSERAVDDIIEHTFHIAVCIFISYLLYSHFLFPDKQLVTLGYPFAYFTYEALIFVGSYSFLSSPLSNKSLANFEYVEPSGKDLGINVRKKSENIVLLLNDKDKIQEVRNKAASNRDKYVLNL